MTAPPSPHRPSQRPRSARITDAWQRKGLLAISLLPLSWVYAGLGALRRGLYRAGLLKTYRASVPVVVVGNVIAGGAGKTPVTIHLVQALQALGWRPAVISRGYGRVDAKAGAVIEAHPDSNPHTVGDEPLLIAQRTNPAASVTLKTPVFIAKQRAHAAQAALLAHPDTDLLISDDGLQHLALARDVEIAVFNARGVGNGWQLPAGPLREPWPRPLDIALYAGQPPAHLSTSGATAWPVHRNLADYAIRSNGEQVPLATLRSQPARALAAIAYPQEFFAMLRAQGLQLTRCDALPDHANLADPALLTQLDLAAYAGHAPPTIDTPVLLCTEKDAHKLWRIAPQALAVPLAVQIDDAFAQHVHQLLLAQGHRPRATPHFAKD
ncbi:MAG: tetraacyldisaccharide 4'-kinase [Comamonas sp.]